jgi:hypothetical protein
MEYEHTEYEHTFYPIDGIARFWDVDRTARRGI